MSDTPRTDAASLGEVDGKIWHMECVSADFARELERELAEAKAILQKACDRDWKDETLYQTAVIAANAIYWRDIQILGLKKAAERYRDLLAALEACESQLSNDYQGTARGYWPTIAPVLEQVRDAIAKAKGEA